MSGHTPGPWQNMHDRAKEGMLTIIGNVDGDYRGGVLHNSYDFVASCLDEYGEHEPEAYANARLIAAAPDLLFALEQLVGMAVVWEGVDGRENIQLENSEAYQRARATIAKATGAA